MPINLPKLPSFCLSSTSTKVSTLQTDSTKSMAFEYRSAESENKKLPFLIEK
jgi:hypothetical protein